MFSDTCMGKIISLLILVLACSQVGVLAIPPPTVTCKSGNFNCTITGTYGVWPDRSICRAAQAMFPTTEQEILSAVAFGARNNLKMKVVTRFSHSIPKLVCPGGNHGLVISTRDYNKKITIDKASMLVTVDSGVELPDFLRVLAASDLAFPHSPYWSGVTIGGILGTGAHGSSLTGLGSAVHEYVDRIRLVVLATAAEGYAKVITFTGADRDLDAVKVALGVLGVLSEITLRVQPMFKRSVTNTMRSDQDLEQVIKTFANGNEFGDITWYPSFGQAVYRVDVRVPQTTAGNGLNDFIGFQPTATFVTGGLRSSEEFFQATGNEAGICARAKLQAQTLFTLGYGFKNNGLLFTGYPVIGNQSRIQTSGRCTKSPTRLETCPWDSKTKGLFFHQTTVSIALDKGSYFIADVKKLRSISSGAGLCDPDTYYGFYIRYVRRSTAYLGKPSDSIDIDITYYRADDPRTPRLNEDILEEIEQMAVFKYAGTPHWGKNRNVAFVNVTSKYPKFPEFLEVKQRLDPAGLFSSEWSDAVLGVSGRSESTLVTDADYCALEGLCICSEDRHCAPEKGYFCTSGKVFKAARVCARRPSL